jgi:triosephosphate isomerase (TIM)
MRQKLVVGNWKMNGSHNSNEELLRALLALAPQKNVEIAVCPPFIYLESVARLLKGSSIALGAQDCSAHELGAYTGEISPVMLREIGCRYVVVGHSERRALHQETDELVAAKTKAALARKLTPIVCVGEHLQEREAGMTFDVVKRQLSAVIHALGPCTSEIVVAYEPVWAIGTGRTATPEQAQEVHAVLRKQLAAASPAADQIKILYGGSVKADNASTLFAQPDIDGGLIGGASLKSEDFFAIARAASMQ